MAAKMAAILVRKPARITDGKPAQPAFDRLAHRRTAATRGYHVDALS